MRLLEPNTKQTILDDSEGKVSSILYLQHRGGKSANNLTMMNTSEAFCSSIRPTGYKDVDLIISKSSVDYRFWLRTYFDVHVRAIAFIGKSNRWQLVDDRMVELL